MGKQIGYGCLVCGVLDVRIVISKCTSVSSVVAGANIRFLFPSFPHSHPKSLILHIQIPTYLGHALSVDTRRGAQDAGPSPGCSLTGLKLFGHGRAHTAMTIATAMAMRILQQPPVVEDAAEASSLPGEAVAPDTS